MTESTASVLIRRSSYCDAQTIERLAARHGQTARGCSFLVAEVHGEIVAAAPLDRRGDVIGESSAATDDVRVLLRRLADAIRRHDIASLRPAA